MSGDEPAATRRHSVAADAEVITDPKARAEAEARNGLRQFDLGLRIVEDALAKRAFRLRSSLILSLHREALTGISPLAGNWRPAGVGIEGSRHQPVGAHLVPELIEELCDYVNDNWEAKTALHLAAYIMWRLNWIHPFSDGNGRTSRILSYVVLCIRIGYVLPGSKTIPDQIVDNRKPYFDALEAADDAWKTGIIDLNRMEKLLESLLAVQLTDILDQAAGTHHLEP
ncbi:Fic family protein [Blastochloris viridis]|uniref:Protein involved in cell division n=1 Tax=Blastochloris viridis TaxID=1079 RepID=A0A0P0IIY4_BLAVI|nr:Fic family protein [Blastochloris viridis]ALK11068.1 Fic/DOC family protein [Blastochloris viridis]CUU43730.1 Protein involved in cell division [Blastochloris viridis]